MAELIQQYGGAGGLFGLIAVLIVNWWRSRNEKTRAQADAIAAMSKALQTALSSVSSLQVQLNGLLEDRAVANAARIEAQNQIDALTDELRRQKADREDTEGRLSAAIAALRAQVKAQEEQITRLQREAEQKGSRIAQLLNRVQTLEREARDKDRRIEELNLALTQAECDKRELALSLQALEAKVNGKADKQPCADDLTASAERVKEDTQPETGAESTAPEQSQEQ